MSFEKLFNIIAVIPIVSPPFIGALAIIMLFGTMAYNLNLLKINNFPIYGFNGLFLAQVVTFSPWPIDDEGRLESMNPVLRMRRSTSEDRGSRCSRASPSLSPFRASRVFRSSSLR